MYSNIVFLLSIHYLVKRNYLIFFVFGFFATFIHNSALIAFMLIFLFSFVRLNLNRTFFLCLTSPIFISLIESYLLKLNILSRYSIYFETEKGILNFKLPLLLWGVVLVLLSTFLFGSKLKAFNNGYRKALVDRIDARYLNVIMWSIVFSVYFFWAGMSLSMVARLSFYYIPFVAIYSAILFSLGNNHGFVIFKYFFISFLILIFPILNKNEVAMLLSYYLNY